MKELFFLFVIIGSSSYLFAQPLTWEEVLSEAKKKNQQIISARQSLNPAKVYMPFDHKHPRLLEASAGLFVMKKYRKV